MKKKREIGGKKEANRKRKKKSKIQHLPKEKKDF